MSESLAAREFREKAFRTYREAMAYAEHFSTVEEIDIERGRLNAAKRDIDDEIAAIRSRGGRTEATVNRVAELRKEGHHYGRLIDILKRRRAYLWDLVRPASRAERAFLDAARRILPPEIVSDVWAEVARVQTAERERVARGTGLALAASGSGASGSRRGHAKDWELRAHQLRQERDAEEAT